MAGTGGQGNREGLQLVTLAARQPTPTTLPLPVVQQPRPHACTSNAPCVQILETKVGKLEQLVRLKDAKIQAREGWKGWNAVGWLGSWRGTIIAMHHGDAGGACATSSPDPITCPAHARRRCWPSCRRRRQWSSRPSFPDRS